MVHLFYIDFEEGLVLAGSLGLQGVEMLHKGKVAAAEAMREVAVTLQWGVLETTQYPVAVAWRTCIHKFASCGSLLPQQRS